MTVIGGMSLLMGPLIGALYIIGVPAFLPLDSAGLAAQKLGWLILILYLPGGIAQSLEPIRTRLVGRLARRHGVDPEGEERAPGDAAARGTADSFRASTTRARRALPDALTPADRLLADGSILLDAVDLHRRFGGVAAVQGVSLQVRAGEILGLIGPNGAGKTTTFELLSGFTRPDSGRVIFDGQDVSGLSPEARGHLGLIRSFQDAALFPTMTVLESTKLAFERVSPTSFWASLLGLPHAERAKERVARELVAVMGLDAYRHNQIQELSTGTRRITEIACLLALRPSLLLLDEPSSGIAQRETEALGGLLRDLKEQLKLTLLVIEHDIPLIMGLSDRIVAMDAGRVIASGSPDEVRSDPLVVEAYLGGEVAAIERSEESTVRRANGATERSRSTRRKEPV